MRSLVGYKVVQCREGRYFSLVDHPVYAVEYHPGFPTRPPRKYGPLFVFADLESAKAIMDPHLGYKLFKCEYKRSMYTIPRICATPEDGGAMRHFWKLFRLAGERGLRTGTYFNFFFGTHPVPEGTVFAEEITLAFEVESSEKKHHFGDEWLFWEDLPVFFGQNNSVDRKDLPPATIVENKPAWLTSEMVHWRRKNLRGGV